jgi:hypothetical protein
MKSLLYDEQNTLRRKECESPYYRVNKIQRHRTYFKIMETDSIILKLSTPCIAAVNHFFYVYYINYIKNRE